MLKRHVFQSRIRDLGSVRFPRFSGTRVMMMPFRLDDVRGSLPGFCAAWGDALVSLCGRGPVQAGVAYLTVDEAVVCAGETHRRPGLHVDGVGPDGEPGAWGGPAGPWAAKGMIVAASHAGCRGWAQDFDGEPGDNGDCAHLAPQCRPEHEVVMAARRAYFCGSHLVHEAIPCASVTPRQFVRVSMPSLAPWYEGYTENPLGIRPTGPIRPPRSEFMAYRRVA